MKLLTPLGLLGLISIIILIIIYIIRPNFQQKMVSTTFMWKLSLKYRKKKIPTSKLRNILLILCQILILTACAFILAKPVTVTETLTDDKEFVVVLDSSASMRAVAQGETRFARAVNKIIDLSDDVYKKGGTMSVIIADSQPYFLAQRVGVDNRAFLEEKLQTILADEQFCSYATSDMKGAISLCEKVIDENAKAQVYVYTDTEYDYVPEQIKVESVRCEEEGVEWNLAILDAYTEMSDNYYRLIVDIACYGRNIDDAKLKVDIHNANPDYMTGEGKHIPLDTSSLNERIVCKDEKTTRIIFINSDLYQPGIGAEEGMNVVYYPLRIDQAFYSYDDIVLTLTSGKEKTPTDSITRDNSFNIYGGQKETLKIQYASGDGRVTVGANPFFSNVLIALKTNLKDWDIQITQVKAGSEFQTSGFDLYVFEHIMPATMPEDGVVLLADPLSNPANSGLQIKEIVDFNKESMFLSEENEGHPLMENIEGENITISRYTKVELSPAYEVLLSFDSNPLLAVKNEVDSKVVVMPFSMHYSNFALLKEFPTFMFNLIRYFLPATVSENAFEVNQTFSLQARGEKLSLLTNKGELVKEFDSFPTSYSLTAPGTYMLRQSDFLGKKISDQKIYVRTPEYESNIMAREEALDNPYKVDVVLIHYDDWLFYIAIALVSLLFIEWWLQCREHM